MDTVWKEMSLPCEECGAKTVCHDLHVEERTWRKIAEKHMAAPWEPWDEWLGKELVDSFRDLWLHGRSGADEGSVMLRVSGAVERDLRASLQAPLVMLYDWYYPKRIVLPCSGQQTPLARPQVSLCCVLPSGARLEVRCEPGGWSVRTCFFMKGVADRCTESWLRYRQLVRGLRLRYTVAPGEQGVTPEIRDFDLKEDSIMSRIRFVNRMTWGLDGNDTEQLDKLGVPWPSAPATPTPKLGRLRPRYRPGEAIR